jgi:hypothetical protein
MLKRIEQNQFFQHYGNLGVKEGLFSDAASALGHFQQQIVKNAYPELIGRRIISVEKTKEVSERFPLASKSIAYFQAEGTAIRLSGDKVSVVTINIDRLAQASEQWTLEFIEDSRPHAIENIEMRISKALAVDETQAVVDLYGCIANADLAGGAPLNGGGDVMDWDAVLALHNRLKGENWRPRVLVLNTTQLSQLLLDNHFIEYEYVPSKEVDLEQGLIRKAIGMQVESSSLVPNGTAYVIDTDVAGIMLIRRDITVEDYSSPRENIYGMKASTRFGLGILRSNAVAKMTNIKTTI